jgi:hypothetical protein
MGHEKLRKVVDEQSDFLDGWVLLGDALDWSYILTARAYGAIEDANYTLKYLILAKEHGWSNWNRILQNVKLRSLFSEEELIGIVSQLK